jgi:hypothetical protein
MFFNDGDNNYNGTPNLYVYEKQSLIGAVHELIIEFRDDILTIFPNINEDRTWSAGIHQRVPVDAYRTLRLNHNFENWICDLGI